MHNLIEYYEENDKVNWHLVDFADTEEEMDIKKVEIAKDLNDMGIETYEVIASKDVNSMKEMLKRDGVKIFRVMEI